MIDQKNHQTKTQQQAAPSCEMWRSKLGTNYPKAMMQKNEAHHLALLRSIRDACPENSTCADCGMKGTVWASVNLGVFLCMTCGAHHRSLGTHISIPKGCTGTYWWGPDELEQMKSKGNRHAQEVYGAGPPPHGLNKDNGDTTQWKNYLVDKYVHRKFAPTRQSTTAAVVQPGINKKMAFDFQQFDQQQAKAPITTTSPRSPPAQLQHAQKQNDSTDAFDLMRFDDLPLASKALLSGVGTQPPLQPAAGDDFFASFGL